MRKILILLVMLSVPLHAWAQTYRINSGSLAATGSVTINTAGFGTVSVQVTGTYVGTIAFEGATDQTNFVAVNCTPPNSATAETTTITTGVWTCTVAGLRMFRARMSAYTSGTAVITLGAATGGGGGGSGGGAVSQSGEWNVNATIPGVVTVTVDNIGPTDNVVYAATPCYPIRWRSSQRDSDRPPSAGARS